MKILNYSQNKNEIESIINRSTANFESALARAGEIMGDVKNNGDFALFKYTKKYDNFNLNSRNLRVSEEEVAGAVKRIPQKLFFALKHAHGNIRKYHEAQFKSINKNLKVEIDSGIEISEKITAVESAGLYVPGGRAQYPSSVLMTAIPANVAGVKRIVITSPPEISDSILAAAHLCGVFEIYRIGGVQAIAALSSGTETIKPVNKIVGPGNIYVMAAKMLAYSRGIGIDMPAGPSEVLLIADETSNPGFIAADVLAQAEHDPDAQCVVVLNIDDRGEIEKIIKNIGKEIENQIKNLNRKNIIESSLNNFAIILTKDISDAIEFTNNYAPEHLGIMCKNPVSVAKKIKNAGAIFIGNYAPVPAGDYASGGNHVLPTSGTARFASGLSVRDFLKFSSVQEITKQGLNKIKNSVEEIAEAEGLDAHKNSVKIRFEYNKR
ncbi:histidinol dehydrogenase [Candidatus Altiarchaeales archaeon WOR_SM1_SCG]|nr:histidinol dehydrogenase [Candidatus Altiarchaeales archaeon WOR_SM1_SCG]